MPNAIVVDATGEVRAFGYVDFTEVLEAGQSQVVLADGAAPPSSTPLHHLKVVGGLLVEASAAEKAAADIVNTARAEDAAQGAVRIDLVVNNTARLPLPPPATGLLVGVRDGGAGVPALAISANNRWFIFDSDRQVGP